MSAIRPSRLSLAIKTDAAGRHEPDLLKQHEQDELGLPEAGDSDPPDRHARAEPQKRKAQFG